MPTEIPLPYWVYVNSSAKRPFKRENEAVVFAKSKVTSKNEVIVMHVQAFERETRLHVWINSVQTVKNGKNTGK